MPPQTAAQQHSGAASALPSGLTLPDEALRVTPPDFHLYSASLEDTGVATDDGTPVLRAIGSSTVKDLYGDVMELSALNDMSQVAPGFAIMLNHDYTLPEDLFGSLVKSPSINIDGGIGDLMLDIGVWQGNPRAAQTYAAIKAKTTLGISVGCMVEEAEWRGPNGETVDQDKVDFWDIIDGKVFLHILHVLPVEFSVVAIPANRRCWVQYAAQGLYQRSLANGNADEALKLAPLVRSWFPKDYAESLSGIEDTALRKRLRSVTARSADPRNVLWSPKSGQFSVNDRRGMQTLERSVLSDLLEHPRALTHRSAASMDDEAPIAPASSDQPVASDDAAETAPPAPPAVNDDALTASADDALADDEMGDDEDMLLRSVTGKMTWPLGERDAKWDNGAAHKRLVEWAGGKDDLSVAKFKSVHFWSPDGDGAQNVSDYKLAFCDVVGGEIKAMPRAIFACAGSHGVDNTDGLSADDKEAIKRKIERYYARMREEFDDDSIVVPWADDKEEGAEPEQIASADEAADAGDPGASTSPATGFAQETETERETPEGYVYVAGSHGEILVRAADGSHEAYDGTHSHSHGAYGSQGDDANHEHEHTHNGDANHDHAHAGGDSTEKAAHPATTVTASAPSVDAARAATLALYNSIGASLGFAPVTLDATPERAKDLVDNDDDAQRVITIVSGLDCLTDELMQILDIPDADKDEDDSSESAGGEDGMATEGMESGDGTGAGTSGDAGPSSDGAVVLSAAPNVSRIIRRTIAFALMQRQGKEFSAANLASLQMIHDELSAMTEGAVCAQVKPDTTASGDDAPTTATSDDGAAADAQPQPAAEMLQSIEAMSKSLNTLIIEVGKAAQFAGQYDSAKSAADALVAQVAEMQAKVASAGTDIDGISHRLDRLKEVSLPRPTHLSRSIQTGDQAMASYDDFFSGSGNAGSASAASGEPEPLDEATRAAEYQRALVSTTITRRSSDGTSCRYWPAGVGVLKTGQSVRPPLDPEQRSLMAVSDWTAYESGGAALVPLMLGE